MKPLNPTPPPHWRRLPRLLTAVAVTLVLAAGGCRKPAPAAADDDHHDAPTNRIDVPPTVRNNLGIQFATVQRRKVAGTLRLPGHFELLPASRYEHRTPIAGRVVIHVAPLQAIEPGDLLYTIDAPDWRKLQQELLARQTSIQVAQARLATIPALLEAHRQHENSLEAARAVMEERVRTLEATKQSVGGQAQELAAASVQLAQVRSQTAEAAEKCTQTLALEREYQAQIRGETAHFRVLLATAATLVGRSEDQLLAPAAATGELAVWQQLDTIEVRAMAKGIVDQLPVASGGWVEVGSLVVAVTDLGKVRFYARGLQSDLPRLRPGLSASVVPPPGLPGATALPSLPGTLQFGTTADPTQRTIDLFVQVGNPPDWVRPGVAAFLEVETTTATEPELAVPLSAVMQDGLDRVYFRRDPQNPDKVIREVADLGRDDGRWIEVKSGLADGDEIVTAGAYALMLASSASAMKGGHFHADGSWHEDH